MKSMRAWCSLVVAGITFALQSSAAEANQSGDWYCDASICGLAAGMSGEVSIGPITADANLPFDTIRGVLHAFAATLPDFKGMFGDARKLDAIRHLLGAAAGWGGNPDAAAV